MKAKISMMLALGALLLTSCSNGDDHASTQSTKDPESSETYSSEKDETYTVVFDLNGGTSPSFVASKEVCSLSASDFFFDCKKDGFNFRGWSYKGATVFDETGAQLSHPTLESPMTFKAIYASNVKLTVGNNMPEAGEVSGGGYYDFNADATLITTPNTGYNFLGWYDEDGLLLSKQTEYNHRLGTTDTSIKAMYEVASYSLSVESNNEENGIVYINPESSTPLDDYAKAKSELVQFKKATKVIAYTKNEDIRFLGWFNEDGEQLSPNAVYSFEMPSHDYRLFAKWNRFAVYYELNGGKNNEENPSEFSADSETSLYPARRNGYKFLGWVDQEKGETVESIPAGTMKDVYLSAQWELLTFNLTYELNGGVNNPNNPTTFTVEDNFDILEPTRAGYTFVGWYLWSSFDGPKITKLPDGRWGNFVLYAKWSLTTYKITYVFNGGHDLLTPPVTYDYETAVYLWDPLRDGYDFDGWYTEPEFENKISEIPVGSVGDLTVHAKWKPIQYLIHYELGEGGTNSPKNPETYTIEDRVLLESPTRPGYEFKGWYSDSDYTTPCSNIPLGSMDEKTFYAKWVVAPVLSVKSNDTEKGEVSVVWEGFANKPVTLTATPFGDCLFEGWYSDGELVSGDNPYAFSMPDHDYSLTAVFWTPAEEADAARRRALGIDPTVNLDEGIVTYGLYPQTHVSDETIIAKLNALTIPEGNGWYLLDGTYYAKLLSAHPAARSSDYYFDDGTNIVSSEDYWFKCDPIKWKILSVSDGVYSLLSTILLDGYYYNSCWTDKDSDGFYVNNYERSEIRTWLNEDFYNLAFSLGDSYLQITEVDNSSSTFSSSTRNVFACSNTEDKVYLLSEQDYANADYGFSTEITEYDGARRCKPSDWAKANRVSYSTDSKYMYSASYWMRTPGSVATYARVVLDGGCFGEAKVNWNNFYYGVRPGIRIDVKQSF